MLSYESLIQQAELRNMPSTKMRGVLREYLHILILKEICKTDTGRKLYFTGGTYLRLVEAHTRFSEDLDFNCTGLDKNEFESLQKQVCIELRRIGLEVELAFSHWGTIYVAKFLFPNVEKFYNVTSRYSKKEGITIKVETNNWDHPIDSTSQLISGFGELYPCICTEKGILFADKIDALTQKNRGRHLFDIMFMLSNKYPINHDRLKRLGLSQDPLDIISNKVKALKKSALKKQAEILRPFLFDESHAELLINAQSTIPQLLKQYNK